MFDWLDLRMLELFSFPLYQLMHCKFYTIVLFFSWFQVNINPAYQIPEVEYALKKVFNKHRDNNYNF